MKFDNVVMNPPYNSSAIENDFVNKMLSLSYRVVSVHPIKYKNVCDMVFVKSIDILNPKTHFPDASMTAVAIYSLGDGFKETITLNIDDDVLHSSPGSYELSDVTMVSLNPDIASNMDFVGDDIMFISGDDVDKYQDKWFVGIGQFCNFHQSIVKMTQENFGFGDYEYTINKSYSVVGSKTSKGVVGKYGKSSGCRWFIVCDDEAEAEATHETLSNHDGKLDKIMTTFIRFERNINLNAKDLKRDLSNITGALNV